MGRGKAVAPLLRLLAARHCIQEASNSKVAHVKEVSWHSKCSPSTTVRAFGGLCTHALSGGRRIGEEEPGHVVRKPSIAVTFALPASAIQNRPFNGTVHVNDVAASTGAKRRGEPVDDEKLAACDRITKIGAGCNVALAAIKSGAGYVSGSTALMADGAASLSDLVSDGITLFSMRASREPSDQEHPYGHGRIETIGALGVGGLLVTTGVGMGYASIQALYDAYLIAADSASALSGHLDGPLWVAMAAGFASLIVKEGLFRATKAAGERAGSKVVIANAWHHRTDAISSLVAVMGVGGAMAGFPLLDPLAGFAVSALIIKMGLIIGWDSVHELADRGLEGSILKEIRASAEAVDGVLKCQSLRGRRMGPFVSVDMLVEVNPWTSVSIAHNIRSMVALRVHKDHDEVAEVFVAAVPKGVKPSLRGEWKWKAPQVSLCEVEAKVFKIVCAKFPEVLQVSFMHTHVLPTNQNELVLVLGFTMDTENLNQAPDLAARLQEALQAIDGVAEADIHLDLTYIPTESSPDGALMSPTLSFKRKDCPENEQPCC